ncbi:MAG: hypothetical protein IPO88_25345 [Nannocystis sp.]|uniref:hypothetical protein n=1 Tax=Nannocystis sp. TaxID=1962667 RepID=UPI002428C8B8|nr:hypothetical protein [Nannocystis sp.]MBK9756763.1 hypothetical protein [Nannocystis sp.]
MSRLKRILLALTILLLVLIGVVAWIFRSRAEPIPEQLAEINVAEADPMKVVIPGSAGLPDLKLADLKGKTAYLVVGDRESMQAGESKLFDRALGRWQLPADVVGYAIADTEGFKLFSSKIDEILGPMRPEIRLPLYVDYEGAITKAFKLPKGHVGVVVLGPDGAVTLRHSGPPVDKDDKILKELKAALRAEEPVLPPAPAFKVGDLDNAACEGKTCMFVFLARPVKKTELPGVEGGFDGDMEATWKQLLDPSVRLAGLVADSDKKLKAADEAAAKVRVALVGTLEGLELSQWKTVAAADESRAPFEIPAAEAALVIVDSSGKLALRELGLVRMHKLSRVSELLGVDLSDRRE